MMPDSTASGHNTTPTPEGGAMLWEKLAIGLLGGGAVLYVLSYTVWLADAREPLSRLGESLFITMAIVLAVDRLVHRAIVRLVNNATDRIQHTADNMQQSSEESLGEITAGLTDATASMQRAFEQFSDLLAAANVANIAAIVPTRHTEAGIERLETAVLTQLGKEQGDICIVSVASPDLLTWRRHGVAQGRGIGERIDQLLAQPNNLCRLRVALMDPNKDNAWSKEWDDMEPRHPTGPDIEGALSFLREIGRGRSDRVMFGTFTGMPPVAYCLITEEAAFVELYPFVYRPPSGQAPDGTAVPDIPLGAVGGRLPMLEFMAASPQYNLCRSHFEYIWWNKTSPDRESLDWQKGLPDAPPDSH